MNKLISKLGMAIKFKVFTSTMNLKRVVDTFLRVFAILGVSSIFRLSEKSNKNKILLLVSNRVTFQT